MVNGVDWVHGEELRESLLCPQRASLGSGAVGVDIKWRPYLSMLNKKGKRIQQQEEKARRVDKEQVSLNVICK